MADIVRRGDYPFGPLGSGDWDPFRMMREMMRLDPFRMTGLGPSDRNLWMPSFEVRENGNAVRIIADVPGCKRDDLEVSVHGNRLVVSGHRDFEERGKDENLHTYERQYGQFTRMFTLPDNVDHDHITSELRDGVLTISAPMTTGSRSRKIAIGGTTQKS